MKDPNNIKLDYLLKEYDEMFSEKRYYDGRFYSLISLFISLITVTVSAVAVIGNIIKFQSNVINGIICLIDSIVGGIIFISLYFNRINYVKVCRQINAIRNFCLNNNCSEFLPYNHMYTNDNFPKYHMKKSIHFILMCFLAICNSIFLSLTVLAFVYNLKHILSIILSSITFICSITLHMLFLIINTKKRDQKSDKTKSF